VTKLLGVVAAVLLLGGCNWPQGWHWPRTATSGSNTVETQIYVQSNVVSYQRPYVAWIARVWDQHPELVVQVTDTPPPVGYNRIVIRTGNNRGGVTSISWDSANHLVAATITLDDGVARDDTDFQAKNIIYHEFCHALGGGWGGDDIHQMCNRYPWHSHNWDEVSRVYHDDPG